MIKKADRYTVLDLHLNDIPEKVEHVLSLGMRFMITNWQGGSGKECSLHVFFDEAGMKNYIGGFYSDPMDRIREIVQGVVTDNDALKAIEEIQEVVGVETATQNE